MWYLKINGIPIFQQQAIRTGDENPAQLYSGMCTTLRKMQNVCVEKYITFLRVIKENLGPKKPLPQI